METAGRIYMCRVWEDNLWLALSSLIRCPMDCEKRREEEIEIKQIKSL